MSITIKWLQLVAILAIIMLLIIDTRPAPEEQASYFQVRMTTCMTHDNTYETCLQQWDNRR